MLPSTNRVDLSKVSKKKIWIYGAAYSGKTTFADTAPTPLNLNTDGNVKYVTMPRLAIKDEVKLNGRIVERTYAWDVFKSAIDDLEKGSDFETIVVDLLEDTYQHCRLYMYKELNIDHESDNSFKAWDMIDTEFQKTLKRLLNLDYNIILISHEDTSKDLTKKSGDKITSIRPNIKEKLANKIAGMVDITARVVVEDDGSRSLKFKQDETVFGGGRLKGIEATKCGLTWDDLMVVYDQANKAMSAKFAKATASDKNENAAKTEVVKEPEAIKTEKVVNNAPEMITPTDEDISIHTSSTNNATTENDVVEEARPVRRTRKVR